MLKFNLQISKFFENLNFRITDSICGYAYTLPKREKGVLAYFQRIQEERLKDADFFPNNPEIPKGISLSQEYFYLFEVFHIDEMGEVRKGLQRLFRNSSSAVDVRKAESFINNMETHSPCAWATTGAITRVQSTLPLDYPVYGERLPTFVKQISGYIVKLTPSFVGLIFEVSLNKQYDTRHNEIQSNLLLPKAKIEVNIARLSYKYSIHSSTNAKMDELCKFRRKVAIETQKFLQKFFSGFFSRLDVGSPKWPAIEVFVVRGCDDGDILCSEGQQPFGWLSSFGLLTGHPIFAEEGVYFKSSIRNNDNTKFITDHLLINFDENRVGATSDIEHLKRYSNYSSIVRIDIAPLFIIKEMLLRTKVKIFKNRKLFPASNDILVKEPNNLKKKGNRFLQIIGTLATTKQLKIEFERWILDSPYLWNEQGFLDKSVLLGPQELSKDNYTLRQHLQSIILDSFYEVNSFLETNQSVLKTIIEVDNIKKTTGLAIVAIVVALISLVMSFMSNESAAEFVINLWTTTITWLRQLIQSI